MSKTLERYEKDILSEIDVVVAISENEAQGYRDWGYDGPIHLAGFGIDMGGTPPPPSRAAAPLKLFHLGAMDWGPNKEGIDWFLNEVWPPCTGSIPMWNSTSPAKDWTPRPTRRLRGHSTTERCPMPGPSVQPMMCWWSRCFAVRAFG